MATSPARTRWVLEIVRGQDIGRRYVLGAGETTIGNALAGAAGFDLADQEANSPRCMAGQHACVMVKDEGLFIRDLESPGGTFVNRQRLLSAQVRPLQPGDRIQLGGVQLEVKREDAHEAQNARPAPPRPVAQPPPQVQPKASAHANALSLPFTIPGGSQCRSWDDFLTLAAQRWTVVREELMSGRIAEHLRRMGRSDLLPRPDPKLSADEQLDAWLARLPATRSGAPELDVHPQTLRLKAATGGGLIRKSLRITNVGYRLLRSTVRLEPAPGQTIRVASEFTARPFVTIDHTDVPVEIELPENSRSAALGTVIVESNGGTRRIDVLLERPITKAGGPEGLDVARPVDIALDTRPLGEPIRAQSSAQRLVLWPSALVIFRLLVLLAGLIPVGPSGGSRFEPRLGSIALLLAAAGAIIGGTRADEYRDRASCGFAGAMAGLLAAAIGFAIVRSVETLLGGWAGSPIAAVLLWALLGVVIALLSWLALPPSRSLSKLPPEPST